MVLDKLYRNKISAYKWKMEHELNTNFTFNQASFASQFFFLAEAISPKCSGTCLGLDPQAAIFPTSAIRTRRLVPVRRW